MLTVHIRKYTSSVIKKMHQKGQGIALMFDFPVLFLLKLIRLFCQPYSSRCPVCTLGMLCAF